MDTSRCAGFSDSQSDSDDSTRIAADPNVTESAMVVLDHHNYDVTNDDGDERIALASALVAMDESDYEVGKGWDHVWNMR